METVHASEQWSHCLFSSHFLQQHNFEPFPAMVVIVPITGTKQLERGEIYFGSQLWRRQCTVVKKGRQNSSYHSSQEAKQGRGKRQPQNTAFSGASPAVLLPPSRHQYPSFHHLSIMSSCYKSIKGLAPSLLTQSLPHDPILHGSTLTGTPRGAFP